MAQTDPLVCFQITASRYAQVDKDAVTIVLGVRKYVSRISVWWSFYHPFGPQATQGYSAEPLSCIATMMSSIIQVGYIATHLWRCGLAMVESPMQHHVDHIRERVDRRSLINTNELDSEFVVMAPENTFNHRQHQQCPTLDAKQAEPRRTITMGVSRLRHYM